MEEFVCVCVCVCVCKGQYILDELMHAFKKIRKTG
jgi:hypothetical protein